MPSAPPCRAGARGPDAHFPLPCVAPSTFPKRRQMFRWSSAGQYSRRLSVCSATLLGAAAATISASRSSVNDDYAVIHRQGIRAVRRVSDPTGANRRRCGSAREASRISEFSYCGFLGTVLSDRSLFEIDSKVVDELGSLCESLACYWTARPRAPLSAVAPAPHFRLVRGRQRSTLLASFLSSDV